MSYFDNTTHKVFIFSDRSLLWMLYPLQSKFFKNQTFEKNLGLLTFEAFLNFKSLRVEFALICHGTALVLFNSSVKQPQLFY
jgi:hypothetical protein